jgi:hypothetical protein
VQQNVYVTQTNRGCFSGCGTAFAVILVIGLAVEYWYAALAIVVIAAAIGIWYYRSRQAAAPSASGQLATAPCVNCGQQTTGSFCSNCGAAQARACSGCARTGLLTPFCPECGAATYLPPTPT